MNFTQAKTIAATKIDHTFRTANDLWEITITHPQQALSVREGANKQVISSQADSLIKISRIWADFFPANTSNQPI